MTKENISAEDVLSIILEDVPSVSVQQKIISEIIRLKQSGLTQSEAIEVMLEHNNAAKVLN